MGQSKDLLIEDDQKWHAAIEIGVRSGVLRECGLCEEVTEQSDDGLEAAYKLGNALITQKDALVRHFKTRQELTDLIQTLPDEFSRHVDVRGKRQRTNNRFTMLRQAVIP
jgi:hypothetical protein